MMKKYFIFILLLALFPLNVFAINYELEIVGNNTLTAGERMRLQSDFVVLNDMCRGIPDCQMGEVKRTNVSTSTVWSSSNTKIATVSNSGVVTGVSEGTVVIKAVYEKDGFKEETKKTIKVKKKTVTNTTTTTTTTETTTVTNETNSGNTTEVNNTVTNNNETVETTSTVTSNDETVEATNVNADTNNNAVVSNTLAVENPQVVEVPDTFAFKDFILPFLGTSLLLGTIYSIVIYRNKLNKVSR